MNQDAAVAKLIAFHSRPRRKAYECLGHYVVGYNAKFEALCLVWADGDYGHVDKDTLAAIFTEARGAHFQGPIHVHAASTEMGEVESFRFYQEG